METRRGRPRSTAVDAAVTAAVTDLLESVGYRSLSIDAVAAAAGIARATIYRRWPSKAEMVFAIVVHDTRIEFAAAGTSLAEDLSALVGHIVALLSDRSARAALPGLLADLTEDPALATRFHAAFIQPQRRLVSDLLAAARHRGELARVPDPDAVHARILGAVFTPLFLLAEPAPADLAERIAADVLSTLPTTETP